MPRLPRRRMAMGAVPAAFAVAVTAGQAGAKGTAHEIEFLNGAESTGEIRITVTLERTNGQLDDYVEVIYVDELPTDRYWKAAEYDDYLDNDNPYLEGNVQSDNTTVRFWVADDADQYEDIQSIEVEEDTGESVRIDDDAPTRIPIVQLSMDVTGTGTAGGSASFGLGDPGYPVATVGTEGLTGDEIEDALIDEFNLLYTGTDFVAQRVEGRVTVEDVPCPLGVLAATTDTALSYKVKLMRTRWVGIAPALRDLARVGVALLVAATGGTVLVRRWRLSAR